MKKPFLNSIQSLPAILTAMILLLFVAVSQGQPCIGDPNPPSSPLCQSSADPFKVLLVLDESGSIGGSENKVEAAVDSFAAILNRKSPGTGKIFMGIVEFDDLNSNPIPVTDVKAATFISTVKDYLYNFDGSTTHVNYQPSGSTDFVGALTRAASVSTAERVDIIFFITDGNPNTGPNTTPWIGIANSIKNAGTYIFGIAVGSTGSIGDCSITALSGPEQLGTPNPSGILYTLQNGADWTRTNFTGLAEDLANFANSISDTQGPTITCPTVPPANNDLNQCSRRVTYVTPVGVDNCPGAVTIQTQGLASNAIFPVGTTVNVFKVTDGVNNTATCQFTVTVVDSQGPTIACPIVPPVNNDPNLCSARVTYTTPSGVDNCSGAITTQIQGLASNAIFPVGSTVNVFKVTDAANNTATCQFTITVVDTQGPTIACPTVPPVNNDPNLCSARVSYSTPVGVDNCLGASTTQIQGLPSNAIFPVGSTVNVFKVTDSANNTATCKFTITVVDNQPPAITCPVNIREGNAPGLCGKNVVYPDPIVTDNCSVSNVVCTPPSGNFFNVGQTIVNCKATDNAGNASTCSFKVTILDLEAPKIVCPANKLISCEESSTPSNTGSPVTSDNCAVATVSNTDIRVDGSCTNEFTLNRTWTVTDVHGNQNTCLQIISVEDKKAPIIKCPVNITVECDTAVAKTGLATATDNCDPTVSLSRRDIHISGDCEWFCVTERHWTATDDCRNTSKCVQVITKDVTPLIEKALAAGPLVWGQTAATVTLPPGKGACVVKWLPYIGVVPTALKFDDAVADANCALMTNPMDRNTGQIVNPLLGEAMKLKILVRLNPALGLMRLKADLNCEMHFIVRQALGGGENATVNELLRVTDLTLGNVNVNLLVPEHCLELLKVLKCVNLGRTVCNNP